MAAKYADQIAQQFVNGERVSKSHRLYEGVRNNGMRDVPTLFSYGEYFPIAARDYDGGFWVNETPYFPTDADKIRAGWALNPYRNGKRMPSPTTKGHRYAVEGALQAKGFAPTDTTIEIETVDPNGRTLELTLRLWE